MKKDTINFIGKALDAIDKAKEGNNSSAYDAYLKATSLNKLIGIDNLEE